MKDRGETATRIERAMLEAEEEEGGLKCNNTIIGDERRD